MRIEGLATVDLGWGFDVEWLSEMKLKPLVCVAVLLALAGCGRGRPKCVPVSGQVLIDGQPLRCGFIRVIPAESRAATGPIDAQGRFCLTTFEEADGCVLGAHPVEVIASERAGTAAIRWLVPLKYQKASTSGIQVVIDGATDELVIRLSWEGGKPWVENSDATGDVDPARIDVK